jgi:hypothetical protein
MTECMKDVLWLGGMAWKGGWNKAEKWNDNGTTGEKSVPSLPARTGGGGSEAYTATQTHVSAFLGMYHTMMFDNPQVRLLASNQSINQCSLP